MKISSNRYGKKRVRVLKVLRNGARHEVKEINVSCLLEGDFDSSYAAANNSKVVPTDTVKNTVTVLAHQHLGAESERYALVLGQHFLAKYDQVERVQIELLERRWDRHAIQGQPHEHSFVSASGTPFVKVTSTRKRSDEMESGIDEWLIMKSTGSGFVDYPKCDLTTLPETTDRILATQLKASWLWKTLPQDFNVANRNILEAMLAVFATNYSASVQATMYEMAEAAFKTCAEIQRITMALPNKHYLLANLKPFGLENPNVTFIPTDEPHGQIEAVFSRD